MNRRAFLRTTTAAAAMLAAPRVTRAQAPTVVFASTTGATGLLTQAIKRLDLEKKYDVKVDAKIFDPAAAERAVLLRQADAGVFPVLTAADLRDKGQDIVLFAPLLYIHIYLLVWKDSSAQTFADLKGKRIGVLDKVSGSYRGCQLIAAKAGLDFERDFQPVTGPSPALITFIQRKQVDALAIHEPIVSRLLAGGDFRVILGINDEWKKGGKPDWLFTGVGAHRDWLSKNRAVAKRLADMVTDAERQLSHNPDLFEAEAEFLGLRTREEIDLVRQRMPRFYPPEWNDSVAAGALDPVREAVKLGQIKRVPPELVTVLK